MEEHVLITFFLDFQNRPREELDSQSCEEAS